MGKPKREPPTSITIPGPTTLGGLVRRIQLDPERDYLEDRAAEFREWIETRPQWERDIIANLDKRGIAPGSPAEKRVLEACFGNGPASRDEAAVWAQNAYALAAPIYIRRWMCSPNQPFVPGRNHLVAGALKVIVDACESKVAPLVLDWGCGSADYGIFLASCGIPCDAVDLQPHADFVNWRLSKREIPCSVWALLEHPGFVLGTDLYDAVICAAVLEHVPNPLRDLAALLASLKPGGHLMLAQYPHKPTNTAQADHMNWCDEERDECLLLLREQTELAYDNGIIFLHQKHG